MSADAPTRTPASSVRIVLTLAAAGVLSGVLLVFVYQATLPAIQAHKAEMLRLAVSEVLDGPASTTTLYEVDGRLVENLPEGAIARDFKQAHAGFDADGELMGFALSHSLAGFQDQIKVIFGYDLAGERVLGMKVLESKETPGLGDKIEKDDAFVSQFLGVRTPLHGVKQGAGRGEENEIDMITGATISSRTVIDVINAAVLEWTPLLAEWTTEEQGS